MAKHKQWFPFDVGLYLKNTGRLTTQQHGAYLLLMLSYWEEGAIPDNAATLQHICRCNADAMHDVLHVLEKHFLLVDGEWVHETMDALKIDQHSKYLKRKEAAQKRWSNADAKEDALHEQGESVSISNTSVSSKKDMSEKFDTFWDACPKRGKASNPKKPARIKFIQLVRDGMDPSELIGHAKLWRKNAEDEGIAGSAITPQVLTWLSQERWDGVESEPAVDMVLVIETQKQRLFAWRNGADWKPFWGGKPGEPDCTLLPEVLDWWALENRPESLARTG